jgi:uncharacterized protein
MAHRRLSQLLLLALLLCAVAASAAEKRVLVYTRNFVSHGQGFVHDCIPASVEAIRKMGRENGFAVEVSEDPGVFTDANLKRFQALVFSNSNNEAFATDAQRTAFRKYTQSGGGFVGIHSASGSERQWPYFWSLLGGRFLRHSDPQKFLVQVRDPHHPATAQLPAQFEWEDECYYHEFLNPDIHPLLVTDHTKLKDPKRALHPADLLGHSLPLAWTITTDGKRSFYTALGHEKEHYSHPIVVKHILGGITWAMDGRRHAP